MKQTIITVLSLALALSVHATLTTDYFEYGTNMTSLAGLTTADTFGWGANNWSGSANPIYNVSTQSGGATPTPLKISLSFSATGYVNNSDGGVLLGGLSAGAVTRSLAAAQSNDLWVSMLIDSTFWGAGNAGNHGYFQVNGSGSDWLGLYSPLAIMAVVENGVETNSSDLNPTDTQLIVAKMATDVSGANDELTAWFVRNGVDLSGLDVAALDAAARWKYQTPVAHDIWGASVSSVGLEIKSVRDPYDPSSGQNRYTYMDNLRVSYGGLTDDQHVMEVLTGVPEPAVGLALVTIALAGLRRRA